MIVLPKRSRLRKALSFTGSGGISSTPETPVVSNALSLLHINLQKGCSSVVHPSSDAERSSSGERGLQIPSLTSLSSSSSSPCGSPRVFGSPSKPHKFNDHAWESVQAFKSPDGSLDISNFKLLQRVGGGDIGNVFLAELTGTGLRFAVKIMDKDHLTKRNKLHRVTTEKQILETLDHPFLPTLYGSFDTPEFACFVMEFCPGGDLHKLRQMQPEKRFDEDTVRFYTAEVLLAIEYLHMMGVVYRDLKPENVLVREDGHIMLTDFDLSLQFNTSPRLLKPNRLQSLKPSCVAGPGGLYPFISCANPSSRSTPACSPGFLRRHGSLPLRNRRRNEQSENNTSLVRSSSALPQLNVEPLNVRSMSFVGTHEYLAPEIIAGGGHGGAVDWWTLGVFVYELLFGQTPFKGANNDATLMNAFSRNLMFPADVQVSQCARDLIRSLLVKDPRRRLGYSRGAADIKTHTFFEDINWPLIRWTQPPLVPEPFKLSDQPVKCEDPGTDFECF